MGKSSSLPSHRWTVLRHDHAHGTPEDVLKDGTIDSTSYKALASLGAYPFTFALFLLCCLTLFSLHYYFSRIAFPFKVITHRVWPQALFSRLS